MTSAIDDFDLDLAYTILEMYVEDRIDSDLLEHRSHILVKTKGHLYLFLVFVGMATAEQVRDEMPARLKRQIKRNKRKGLPGGLALRLMGDDDATNSPHYEILQSASQIVVAFANQDDEMAVDLARAVMTRGNDYVGDVIHQTLSMFRMITRGPDNDCPAFGRGHDHD